MAVKVPEGYDFAGYATRNDVLCADGRTIRQNAFKAQNGKTVPLVWNHMHNDMKGVIGHALLENRNDGVYCYGYLNNTDLAQNVAKEQIRHGDIKAMSIYANHLKQKAGDVVHGVIREVSLVLAGANEGAFIDWVLEHSDEIDDDDGAGIIYPDVTDSRFFLYHKDDEDDEDEYDDDDDEDDEDEDDEDEDADDDEDDEDDEDQDDDDDDEDDRVRHSDSGETIGDVLGTLSEKQMNAVYALIGVIGEGNEEDEDVKHNVFDNDTATENYLSHEDMEQIFSNARRIGSLKDAVLQHCEAMSLDEDDVLQHDDVQSYGIQQIDALFPEYKNLNNPPEWIKRETDWVHKVLNGAHHTPFSRIKSQYANITEDEARAKGYIKGHMKKEEVFSLLRRTTDPCTIYKKQKLDRDDIIDIVDFDVVAWIKAEMRMMLDEEIARAILVGDGRLVSDEDHIPEDHIRPIWKEADLFAVKVTITMKAGATDDDRARAFIRANIKARKYYKGTGSPKMFTTDSLISDMLLLEDGIGHRLYESEASLATACRVTELVPVEIMEGLTDETQGDLAAISINMTDYNVGADKGGAVSMFDDFDIDYNQQKYLIETRCSGAMIKPYSALVFSFKQGEGDTTVITFSGDGMDEFKIEEKAAG